MEFDQTDHLIVYLISKLPPYIDKQHGGILTFQLAKLLFLIDYEYFKVTGKQASNLKYVWYKYGPYPLTDFEPRIQKLEGFEIVRLPMTREIDGRSYNLFYKGSNPRFKPLLTEQVKLIVDKQIFIFGEVPWEILRQYVYSIDILQGLKLKQPIDFTKISLLETKPEDDFLKAIARAFKEELELPLSDEHLTTVKESIDESTNDNVETAKRMLARQRLAYRLNNP